MKIIFFIAILVFTITGCAPNRYGTIGDNENSVSVNVNIFDKAKGPIIQKQLKLLMIIVQNLIKLLSF